MTRAMVVEQISNHIVLRLARVSDNRIILLLMINVILLTIGMLVDETSNLILAAIVGADASVGIITPPCAPLLNLAGTVRRSTLPETLGPALKFLSAGILPAFLLVICFPDPALFIPRVLQDSDRPRLNGRQSVSSLPFALVRTSRRSRRDCQSPDKPE